MKKSKELLLTTVIVAIGNLSTKLISFFLLPLYTSKLTASDYGTYDLIITIATFVIPMITLLMEESMFRFLIDCKTTEEKKEVISHTIFFISLGTFLLIICYCILSLFIKIPFSTIFIFYLISNIALLIKNALTRGLGKVKLYTLSNFISSVVVILLNLIFILKYDLGVYSLLLSSVISNIFVSIFVFIRMNIFKYISFKNINKNKISEMAKYSLPLVPNSLSWTVINLSDRIIISSYLGTSENGIYSMSYKFPNLIDTFYGFFYTAWKESAAKSLKDNDTKLFYNKVYSVLKDFLWSIIIMTIAALPLCFDIMIKNEFKLSYVYIPILILSMYFSNISGFYGGIFSAYKDTKIMGITTIVSAVTNLIINLILIKFIGLWAAALSTLIATMITYMFRKIKIKKYVEFDKNMFKQALSICSFIIAIISYYCNYTIMHLILFTALLIYCIIINKEIIIMLYKYLLKKKKQIKSI